MFRKDTKFGASAALIALVGGDFNVRILLLWFIATEGTESHRFFLKIRVARRRNVEKLTQKITSK